MATDLQQASNRPPLFCTFVRWCDPLFFLFPRLNHSQSSLFLTLPHRREAPVEKKRASRRDIQRSNATLQRNLRRRRPQNGPQCQVSGQMSGKMRYSLQTWPRRAARAGGPPRVPGGPPGGQDRGCDPNHRLRHPPRWCGSGATPRNLPDCRSVPPKRPRSGPAGRNRGIFPTFCRCTPKTE